MLQFKKEGSMEEYENDEKKMKRKKNWKVLTEEGYQKASQLLCHFSAKLTNSNTKLGIRLGKRRYNIPYISVSTLQNTEIPFDLINNAKDSPLVNQINAVIKGYGMEDYETPPDEERANILAIAPQLDEYAQVGGMKQVPIRLRQIILQNSDGTEVAATPLASAGLMKVIFDRVKEEWKTLNPLKSDGSDKRDFSSGFQWRPKADLHVGGQNAQNVTVHQAAVRSPLVFFLPTKDKTKQSLIRKAYSLHHRGLHQLIDRQAFIRLVLWQKDHIKRHLSTLRMNLRIRRELEEVLYPLVESVKIRAQDAHALLQSYKDQLPKAELTSPELAKLKRALIDPTLRDSNWSFEFADYFLSELKGFVLTIQDKQLALEQQYIDYGTWIKIIMAGLE